ncbi:MAG: cytochrome c3 family protein [Coriobacteriia bacterium]
MRRYWQVLIAATLCVLAFVATPSTASAWTESGGGSSVDPAYEVNGCEFCHGTAATFYPYTRPNGIHGGYTATSDQCASCHNVHDAAGAKLMPKATVTATCLACHDGTGGFGVYGTIKARTGADPAGGHSAITGTTNIVPGGDSGTGGTRVEAAFHGEGGFLGCVDCHSPHGSRLVDAYSAERQRYDREPAGYSLSTNLLKQTPNGSDTTTTVYGSAWCAGCHRGRHSDGAILNHPVDSDTYSVGNVPLAPWPGVIDISINGTNGNVFVADPGNRRIKKFTSAGTYVGEYTMWNGTRLLEPRGVAVATANLLWVGDPRMGYLALFNQDFGAFGATNPFLRPGTRLMSGGTYDLTASGVGTNADGTKIAVVDTEANVVTVRNADTTSAMLYALRPAATPTAPNPFPSTALGGFYAPTDAVMGTGDIAYVVDSMNNRVQRFDSAGVVIGSFGAYGSGPGQFDRPLGIAVDAAGRVYVADAGNHRIQRFSSTGVFETTFGTVGSGPGQFRLPSGVAVSGFNGDVYVVDAGNSRVQRLTSAGVYVGEWGTLGSAGAQFIFQPQQVGPMGYATDQPYPESPLRQMYKGLVYAGRGFVMQDPRTPAQAGHGPICQQCHEDARNAGALYDGLAVPAIAMTVLDGRLNDVAAIGERDVASPRFQNFPHETSNAKMVIETNDDLCTNCHSLSNLP